MQKRLLRYAGVALVTSAIIAGCADRVTTAPANPAATQPSNNLIGGLLGGVVGTVGKLLNVVVSLVERPTPLQQDVVWSFDAGPAGALSGNRAAGLSIAIPAGALDRNVRITVTARAGKIYDYHFEPEGLQFAKPVVLTQDVSDNSLLSGLLGGLLGVNGGKSVRGAYYAAPSLQYDPKTDQATVNELEPTVNVPGYVTFQIRHFSGYTVAMCDNGSSFGGF